MIVRAPLLNVVAARCPPQHFVNSFFAFSLLSFFVRLDNFLSLFLEKIIQTKDDIIFSLFARQDTYI